MDTKIVRYILCRMLGVEAALLLVPVLVAVIYQEKCGIVFLIPIVILCLLFWVVGRKRPEHGQIYGKEGMVIVALAWILWSLFGAMPFTLSGYIPSYVDAFFETVSGFTTTGSSIIPDVEVLPHCSTPRPLVNTTGIIAPRIFPVFFFNSRSSSTAP